MKHGAIFDMDGLLFDTERFYQEAWLKTAPSFGRTPSLALAQAVCGTSGDHLKQIVVSYYPGINADAYIQTVLHQVEQRLSTDTVKLMPGACEILTYLAERGVKLAVASGSPKSIIETNLLCSGITSCFDVVISGFEVARPCLKNTVSWSK